MFTNSYNYFETYFGKNFRYAHNDRYKVVTDSRYKAVNKKHIRIKPTMIKVIIQIKHLITYSVNQANMTQLTKLKFYKYSTESPELSHPIFSKKMIFMFERISIIKTDWKFFKMGFRVKNQSCHLTWFGMPRYLKTFLCKMIDLKNNDKQKEILIKKLY